MKSLGRNATPDNGRARTTGFPRPSSRWASCTCELVRGTKRPAVSFASTSFQGNPFSNLEISRPFSGSADLGVVVFPRRVCGHKSSTVVFGLPFAAPQFSPSKLSVEYTDLEKIAGVEFPVSRCYTLTHNDLTGDLFLTVGSRYNLLQISGWYTRLVRDEVVAQWQFSGPESPCLRIHCHVSGKERWLAPPQLRDYIFQREMNLVLDCFLFGDRHLLSLQPDLLKARVKVHFHSHYPELDRIEEWGILGDRGTWRPGPVSPAEAALARWFGIPAGSSGEGEAQAPAAAPCGWSAAPEAEEPAASLGERRSRELEPACVGPSGRSSSEASEGVEGATAPVADCQRAPSARYAHKPRKRIDCPAPPPQMSPAPVAVSAGGQRRRERPSR